MANDEKKGFLRTAGEFFGFVPQEEILDTRDRLVFDTDINVGVLPAARSNITYVAPETALGINSVYRAVSIITASVSQMGIAVYRDGVEIDSPPIIKSPNINDTQKRFVEETVFSLATYGNAYWRVSRRQDGTVTNIEVMDPAKVQVVTHPNTGRPQYLVGTKEVPAKNIKHLKLMSRPGALKGYGPIQTSQSELTGIIRTRAFADNWFASGVPQGMLSTEQRLNPTEIQELVAAYKKFLSDNDGTMVAHSGLDYKHFNIKPAEAQFLEIQQSHTVAVARLFGVPPTLLATGAEGNTNTYINQQEMFLQFLETTLIKYMNEIEDALTDLIPRGQVVKFKEDTFLRMNTVLQTEVDEKRISSGVRTVDEIRKRDGLPPLNNTNEGAKA